MSRPNSKVIETINGYEVLRARNSGEIFLRSSDGVNFSFPIETLERIAALLQDDDSFVDNFYDKNVFYSLVDSTDTNSRPNEKILAIVDGYQIFKARDLGSLFLQSPQGVCFTLEIDVLLNLYNKLADNDYYSLFV